MVDNIIFGGETVEGRTELRSKYREIEYANIYKICYDIMRKLNGDIINIIMGYTKESITRSIIFVYDGITNQNHEYDSLIIGKYVSIALFKWMPTINGDIYYHIFLNINKNIGNHLTEVTHRVYSDYKYEKYNEYYDMRFYGLIFGIFSNNNEVDIDDDFKKYLPNIMKYVNNIHGDTITQIRQGKYICSDTLFNDIIFNDIINNNLEKYYFISASKSACIYNYLVELTEDEYIGIIEELKEINRLI